MKSVSKIFPLMFLFLFSSSSYASFFGFSDGQKLDVPTALSKLRAEFTDAGIVLNMDTPSLSGTTPDGEECSIDLSRLAQIPGCMDMATVTGYVGGSSVVFQVSPKTGQDAGTYDIRELKSPNNVLSLSDVEDHTGIVPQVFTGGLTYSYVHWHRSIEITKDDQGKITSVHIKNKNESGDLTCNIPQ